jgi:aldose 1-epimerase
MKVEMKRVTANSFGIHRGKDVMLFRIVNQHGAFIEVTNYGATLVSVVVDDKYGNPGNVILGYPSLEGYLTDKCYIGSTIGRFANRIGNAQFTIDDVQYELDRNDGANSNHGGKDGFHGKVFDYQVEEDGVRFSYFSPDGEGGFPGNVRFNVEFRWNDEQELSIRYTAETDRATVMNFTNHAYFNLSAVAGSIGEHKLTIVANEILEMRDDHVPTGKVLPAGKKAYRNESVKDKFVMANGKLKGLNTYYVFDINRNKAEKICVLREKHSGRQLEVFTTFPGMQFYTGDFLMGTSLVNHGRSFLPFDGLCLECQYYPDSPNHRHFPSTVITPGQKFDESIRWKFGVSV